MKKPIQNDAKNQKTTLATSDSLLNLQALLKKFAEEAGKSAADLHPAGVNVRGREGVDVFIQRLDGYLRNVNDANGKLVIGEPKDSYHSEKNPPAGKRKRLPVISQLAVG